MSYEKYDKINRERHIGKINDNLFLGSSFSTNHLTLKEFGITYIFNLGFTITNTCGCKNEYFDLDDNSQSVQKMMSIGEYISKKIDKLIQTEKILICCVAGKSRSASMVALYLHHKYPKLTYEEIIKEIKKVRSISINQTFADAIKYKIDRDKLLQHFPSNLYV
jgi:hypothetical protein